MISIFGVMKISSLINIKMFRSLELHLFCILLKYSVVLNIFEEITGFTFVNTTKNGVY